MSVETCADAVLVFSCPQRVCELDSCLCKLVLMLSLCFPALRECVNLIHVCANLCPCCPCVFLHSDGVWTQSVSVQTRSDTILVFTALRRCMNLIHVCADLC